MTTSPSLPHSPRTTLIGLGLCCMLTGGVAAAQPAVTKTVKPAAGLYELVSEPATGTVYVAATGTRDAGGPKILALDAATLEPKSSIDLSAALFGLAINRRTRTLYGTATRDGLVSAIDLATGKVVASISHGEGAHVREAVVDEAANRIYVSVVGGGRSRDGSEAPPSRVWVIDGKTHSLIEAIDVPAATLTGIALDAGRQRLYGTAMGDNEVVVVDLAQKKIAAKWPAGGERPTNIVFDAAGQRLFIANQGGSLSVLDAGDGRLLKSVNTGEGALSVAFSPEKQQVYVANRQGGTLTVVDANSYAVLANLKTGTLPQTIAIDEKSGLVYVSNKARGRPRNAPADAPVAEDPAGDTVTLVHP